MPSSLTPIKVKGKGPRTKPWAPPGPMRYKQRLKRQRQPDGGHTQTGPSNSSQNTEKKIPTRKKRIKTRKPPAHIEQLPTEILEHIFFLSRNLNFPRASRRIGCLLSHPSLYTELLVSAFAPTWELWLGGQKQDFVSYFGYLDDHDRFGGDPEIQSQVLACPWVSVSLIQQAQESWRRRRNKLEKQPRRDVGHASEFNDNGGGICTSFAGFQDDLETLKVQVQFEPFQRKRPSVLNGMLPSPFNSYLEKHPLTRVPDHLLVGPFDWDKVKLLFWFLRNGGHVMPFSSPHYQSWELTKRGYERIVALQDPIMAHVLVRLFWFLQAFTDWPEHLISEKLSEAKGLRHLDLTTSTFQQNFRELAIGNLQSVLEGY